MIISTTGRACSAGTARQPAKAQAADKAARQEQIIAAKTETEALSGSEQAKEDAGGKKPELAEEARTDVFLSSVREEAAEQEQGLFPASPGFSPIRQPDDSEGLQMKSSAPEDSVGQLAAMLARAETKLDVLQVFGKATRALVNLKASAATAKGDDAKKLAAQIRRMEKLMKRIEKKLKHLGKEEDLEREQKRAVEKAEKEKAEQIEDELKTRRKKRRRDEKNYADKELAEDQKNASSETLASLSGMSSASAPSLDAASGMEAATGGEVSASVPDGMSLDVTV